MNEKNVEHKKAHWTICPECHGCGKKKRRLNKKSQLRYLTASDQSEKTKETEKFTIHSNNRLCCCTNCSGSGLLPSSIRPIPDSENFPHVAIIGGGMGGIALAVACLHRSIPFSLYERDNSFNARAQGYGLTLQQASKAIEGLGLFSLDEKVISTKHIVHTVDGKVIGEWGMRKWMPSGEKKRKRSNMHISRQSLRLALLKQLGGHDSVHWGHQLIDLKKCTDQSIELTFQTDGTIKHAKADLVVGADGIRSSVRKLLIGEEAAPLRYLNCMVLLGICPLNSIEGLPNSLLDSATVFQTANGNERIYVMPYTSDSVMWQLSFPLSEKEAQSLSSKGSQALKEEACRRAPWHDPIPQILKATPEYHISGYPVYDRALLTPELLKNSGQITLIGDAAHPMSPFKGQGANQALLDALTLARTLLKECRPLSQWRKTGIRACVLNTFESEMLERSSSKVNDSAAAAKFLHSELILQEADEPRGRGVKKVP